MINFSILYEKRFLYDIFSQKNIHGLSYALLVRTISFLDSVITSVLLPDFEKN